MLLLVLIVAIAALAGAIILLSTNYALYSSSQSSKKKLEQEHAELKSRADQTQQQLDAKTAKETSDAGSRAEAQTRLDKLLPAVLSGGGEVGTFARMIYNLPNRRIELERKPPDKLFRNWRVTTGSTTETYTLVGGFVDGKWVVYSNLVARGSTQTQRKDATPQRRKDGTP